MSSSIAHSSLTRHLERLEMPSPVMAKADLKNLETSWRQQVGRAVARAFSIAGLSQKEAAGLIGRDPGQVGRWFTGVERPQFDAILAVQVLRTPLVEAIAELAGEDVEIETVVRVRRRRSAR